jgi:uncharacterized membrane protein YfcA
MPIETLSLPVFEALLLAVSVTAGCLGAVLGLGGGIILIPVLTLGFHIPIHYAVGAGIVSVIATSSGAAAVYVRERITNVRLAIFLEIATSTGAMIGAVLSVYLSPRFLSILFALVLVQSTFFMLKKRSDQSAPKKSDPLAVKLKLGSSYPDRLLKREVAYTVSNIPLGFMIMLIAGIVSALLGIGSGVLKVLAMDFAMKLPIKVSSATSNFMMGVTAAASAGAYFFRGDIVPELAAPIALGVVAGAALGTRVMVLLPSEVIRKLFAVVLVVLSIQMIWKGIAA